MSAPPESGAPTLGVTALMWMPSAASASRCEAVVPCGSAMPAAKAKRSAPLGKTLRPFRSGAKYLSPASASACALSPSRPSPSTRPWTVSVATWGCRTAGAAGFAGSGLGSGMLLLALAHTRMM